MSLKDTSIEDPPDHQFARRLEQLLGGGISRGLRSGLRAGVQR